MKAEAECELRSTLLQFFYGGNVIAKTHLENVKVSISCNFKTRDLVNYIETPTNQ